MGEVVNLAEFREDRATERFVEWYMNCGFGEPVRAVSIDTWRAIYSVTGRFPPDWPA